MVNNVELVQDAAIILTVWFLYGKIKRNRARRRYWVQPYLQTRSLNGSFVQNYRDLRKYEDKFFNYTRMSTTSFDYLLSKIRTGITGRDTNFRLCITPEEKLWVTLRLVNTFNFLNTY